MHRAGSHLFEFASKTRHTNSQTLVRAVVVLLVGLVALSAVFQLDIVLGAFAAGFVLRYIVPEGDHESNASSRAWRTASSSRCSSS